jgi:hypothetical protein
MKKILFLLFLIPSLAKAQGVAYHDIAWYNSGTAIRAVPSASISICIGTVVTIPCITYGSIYNDYLLTQPIAQPGFAADVNGNFQFFAGAGTYIVNVSGVGFNPYGYIITLGGSGGGGGGGSVTLQTNGINNSLQNLLNLGTSTANVCGTVITPFATGGTVLHEASGLTNPVCGGSGRTNPPANSVLISEGANPFNAIPPGSIGTCLTSNGPGVDPSYEPCSLSSIVTVANGGTGVANPTAHTIPVAEGTLPFTFISPGTAGWCLLSTGTGSDPNFGPCPSVAAAGSPGAVQYNLAGTLAGLNSPVTNGIYSVVFDVIANAAVNPAAQLPGVLPNPVTGTTYTYGAAFANADRYGYTSFSNAASIAVTLPQAGTTGFTTNWGNLSCNIGVGLVTITPTTSNISYSINGNSYASAASSMPLATGWCAWIFSDNTNYFAIIHGSIGNASTTVTSAAFGANSCSASATTVAMYGVNGSTTFTFSPTTDSSALTGWGANGGLTIDAWPSSNTLNYKVCNQTTSSITSSTITFNVSAR